MTPLNSNVEVAALEQQALEAMRSGQQQRAVDTWARIVRLQPRHATALNQLGQAAYLNGDFQAARVAFQHVVDVDGTVTRQWVNLALSCQQLGDMAAEEAALFKALATDPYDLLALMQRGLLYERQGKQILAASAFGAAAAVAPRVEKLMPELRGAVEHAQDFLRQHNAALTSFLDQRLEPLMRGMGPVALDRFQLSLDILVGRKQRFNPSPMRYFVPALPVIEFFDRSLFPWLGDVEAAWESIRDEFLSVFREDQGFTPYITYNADQPVAQWAELNHSPRWSVFHLVKEGRVVQDNAERCPETMAALTQVPQPEQAGRSPVALFSMLKPKTRIPAHVGASNARLITHLPLIVPPDCEYRVGNTRRPWVEGKAWVFDDTIEHEAWNGSDQPRVVLIFDTWHPMLSAEERLLITAMSQALNDFSAHAAVDYDV